MTDSVARTRSKVTPDSRDDAPVRIGIIGAGFWAVQFYLPFLEEHPSARCVGVVRPGREELRALQDRFELDIASENIADLLSAECDAIIVASPPTLHCEHAIQALRAGAHVLVEKPMGITLTEARELERVVLDTGRGLSVAHGFNYMPMSAWAIDFVQAGRLGRPLSACGYMASALVGLFSGESGYGMINVGGVNFRAERGTWADPAARGGYLYGQLSHLVGLALAFISARPRDVFARAQRLATGVDIDVSVSVQFEDDAIASFIGNGRLPWGVRYPMELRIVGEEGTLSLDFERERADVFLGKSTPPQNYEWKNEVAFSGREPDAALSVEPGDGIYTCAGPVEYLVDCCRGRSPANRAPVELGARAVAILDAANRSLELGEPVASVFST